MGTISKCHKLQHSWVNMHHGNSAVFFFIINSVHFTLLSHETPYFKSLKIFLVYQETMFFVENEFNLNKYHSLKVMHFLIIAGLPLSFQRLSTRRINSSVKNVGRFFRCFNLNVWFLNTLLLNWLLTSSVGVDRPY